MKKDEIDDRLMDALLRGESQDDLADGIVRANAAKIRKTNLAKTVLAIAAVILFAAIAVFSTNYSPQESPAEPKLSSKEVRRADVELATLDAEIEAQKAIVEEKRKVLDTLVRITGRPYFEGSRNSPESLETKLPLLAEKNAFEMKKNRDQYAVYLNQFERLESDQLLRYAAELPVDNNSVRSLSSEYFTKSRELEALKGTGLGESHPEIVASEEQLRGLKGDLDSSVATLRESLATNHELVSKQLQVMEEESAEREGELVQLATEMHEYRDATKEYERSLTQLQELKLRRSTTGMSSNAVAANENLASKELSNPIFSKSAPSESPTARLGREVRKMAKPTSEQYEALADQSWKSPQQEALSTFSVDVDTASYTNLRRLLKDGSPVPKNAVRIEELVNYFDYRYPQPNNGEAFGVGLEMATCPWEPQHNLVRVALQGKEIKEEERGDANLVFLIDVSGSMRNSDKLPLLIESLGLMVEELREKDSVAIVVYAGREGVVLEPTQMRGEGRELVAQALGKLSAGGSTNGEAGIKLAYRLARENFVTGGINRVILATDGDFNVGVTKKDDLVSLVAKEAKEGVFLSVCGFGRGNLNDSMLEAVTNKGNGVYYYIDGIQEGRRVFLQELTGTLVTIAKDVKIQVEFNPSKVGQYRLLGYANRVLKKEDFNNDKVDAGDIGSGHQVTAFYEVIPVGVEGTVRPKVDALKYQPQEPVEKQDEVVPSPDWMTVKLRHKEPDGQVSKLQEFILQGESKSWQEMESDFRFAAGVTLWGMGLREIDGLQEKSVLARQMIGGALDKNENRVELFELLGE